MDITRLGQEDGAAMGAFWRLNTEVHEHDCPGSPPPQRKSAEVGIANLRPDVRQEYHLAYVDGRVAGFVWLLFPLRDNTRLMYLRIAVHPLLRRRGVGSALLDLALRRGTAEGRIMVVSRTAEPLPDGPHRDIGGRQFLRAKGFGLAHSMWDWRVDLDAINGKVERHLYDEALPHAWEYELLGWSGPTPEEHLAAVAALDGTFISEIPLGELDLESKHVDVERQRATESLDAVRGVTKVSVYARHRPTGDLVAQSVISVADETPEHAFQETTLVDREHRGNRLGTLVKIESHRLLRHEFPAARTLWTSVAEVNTHMLAINRRLGYVAIDRQLDFQRAI